MQRPVTSISRSSHLRVVAAGRLPGLTATILRASASATEISGRPEDMAAGRRESDAEDLCIARLDRIALSFDRRGVVFHRLDVPERLAAWLLLRLGMRRAQAADVDDQLLRLAAEAERL